MAFAMESADLSSISSKKETTMDLIDQSLGTLARTIPGATRVFDAHHFDFCCGGKQTLRSAAAQAGVDALPIVAELRVLEGRTAGDGGRDWSAASATELVDHILARYHAVHREQLPELIRMARRVEAVHRENPEVPTGLAAHLEDMEAELLNHMEKEESVLFPALRAPTGYDMRMPIQMMRSEHVDHGEQLERLMRLTDNATPPPGACNTWRALYSGVAQLSDDLIEHIHLENNLLFPRFEQPAG